MQDDVQNEAVRKLDQEEMINESLINGTDTWTVVCDSWYNENESYGGRYSVFAHPDLRESILNHEDWDFQKDDGIPCFSKISPQGREEVTYRRNRVAGKFEPLITIQDFNGVVQSSVVVSEEFRLLMKLWQDQNTGNYYEIRDDGSKECAIRFKGERVEVRTPIIRRYQAAKQLDFVLFTDSTILIDRFDMEGLSVRDIDDKKERDRFKCYWRSFSDDPSSSQKVSSFVFVKNILPHPPQEKCGIWPWEKQEEFAEFIIDEDEVGEEIKYSCDPESSKYLTPVFFKPDVLQPYYSKSETYTVGDGYLTCADMWGVEIDNGNPDVVAVFLGDIGSRIPSSHWKHWQSCNIPPIYTISASSFRRSFLNQWAESDNPEHLFKHKLQKLQEQWRESWDWNLYREPAAQEIGTIKRLRIPLNDTEEEFKAQIVNLALVLIDLLNERLISQTVPSDKGEKGITKLERFLDEYGYENTQRDISLLRKVQAMRSRVAVHASGSSGKDYLDKELGNKNYREYFIELLKSGVTMLDDLTIFAKNNCKNED